MAGTFTPTTLYRGQPGVGSATLYTVPGATAAIVKQVIMANTTALAATVTLDFGAAGAASRVVPAVSIDGHTVYTLDLSYPMVAAEIIAGLQGTAAAITVHILGVLET